MPNSTKREKNLIFCAYASNSCMQTGVNVKSKDSQTIYLKNIIVSLISAKVNNPQCDVALVTNIDIPTPYNKTLINNSVLIFKETFDNFVFPSDYPWGLAFYKLCAMKKVLARNYKNYLLIDTDTFIQSSLDDLWIETNDYIMLYDINHRLTTPNCEKFNKEILHFLGLNRPITNYGGEFIAGNFILLNEFINNCDSVYKTLNEKEYNSHFGDEFIICIVADHMREKVKNAGGYIFRFWTGVFYLTSTCYKFNPVSVLHVPSEKENGMLKLYSYFKKHQKFPKLSKAHKILHLSKTSFISKIKMIIIKILEHNNL